MAAATAAATTASPAAAATTTPAVIIYVFHGRPREQPPAGDDERRDERDDRTGREVHTQYRSDRQGVRWRNTRNGLHDANDETVLRRRQPVRETKNDEGFVSVSEQGLEQSGKFSF